MCTNDVPCEDTRTIAAAASTLTAGLARNADLMGSTMRSLSCEEADALTGLMLACGYPDQAVLLLDEHAISDDAGDRHHQPA